MATLLHDTFIDFDGTQLEAHTMNVGSGWSNLGSALNGVVSAGAMETRSNQASVAGNAIYDVYCADAGQADVTFTCHVTLPNTNNYIAWLAIRVTSRTSWLSVAVERDAGGTPYLQIYDFFAGAAFPVGTPANMPGATNSMVTLTVTTSGLDTVVQASTGESTFYSTANNASATRFGLLTYVDGTYNVTAQYDNFLVVTPAADGQPTLKRFGGIPHTGTQKLRGGHRGGPWARHDSGIFVPRRFAA